ncbi:MAG: YicC family protein [Planctomycetota bacterium]|nr:MAG: YicC family protein [Planctomycetota bacterium]REJ96081.1 MAG: YicC family protein [Planctomycetota bacterium]REK26104.1 MAG: YicC family protein [Planctomycetota bacterium]REK27092.1 MAG: YicC family protein [Planctomycetota bacterium]
MLLSMTGIGGGRADGEHLSVSVELRSVNNRHLKISIRGPDAYLALEQNVEKLIRSRITRGSVQLQLRVERHDGRSAYSIDCDVLCAYLAELRDAAQAAHLPAPSDMTAVLSLPGVVVESGCAVLEESDWPIVREALEQALENLTEFRRQEGRAMADEFRSLCGVIEKYTSRVAERSPQVVEAYRQRLHVRVAELLKNTAGEVNDADLVREVGLFADRSDVNEEVTRLTCHVEQFRELMESDGPAGRRMDFLCQEMNREVNTIGSKANDVEIARIVVDAKAAIERIREIVQNVE